jgi:hypothetical protein
MDATLAFYRRLGFVIDAPALSIGHAPRGGRDVP